MCDVLHAMFEEDYSPQFEQGIEVKERLRDSLYRVLYDEEYKWHTTAGSGNIQDFSDGEVAQPQARSRAGSSGLSPSAVNPETGTMELPEGTKKADPSKRLPRVQPATSMEDLAGVLGTPMGG